MTQPALRIACSRVHPYCRAALGLLLSFVIGWRLEAQEMSATQASTRVAGTVLQLPGIPLRGAVVRIEGVARATLSDSQGRFTLTAQNGEIALHVRALGYSSFDTTLVLTGRPLVPVLVMMFRVATALDTTRVRAVATGKPARYGSTTRFDAFYERKTRAIGGSFLTREDIERADVSDAADLLRRIPGVRVQRTSTGIARVQFPRCAGVADPGRGESSDGRGPSPVVQVFVDGTKVSEPFVTLSSLAASDVEAMEVYRGVADLPPEAAGNGCAAIMIWTRYTPGATRGAKP